MKKYIIVFLIGILALPFAILASVHGPPKCCTLNHKLLDIDIACDAGVTVGAKDCEDQTATLPADSDCIDTSRDSDINADECWVDGDLIPPAPPAPAEGDPDDYPCEDSWLDCWCDADGDGISEAACVNTIAVTKNWGTCCIIDAIYNATDWIFYVLLVVTAIVLLIAGFLFFLSGGDPGKVSKAKSLIIYCAIGLALALMARIIPGIIKEIVS